MFDLVSIIKTFGYFGIFAIIFSETGLLIGLFLPGDSFLFTAGFLASQGYINIALVACIAFIAAVAGNEVGYALGKKFGPMVFSKERSFFLSKEHIQRSELFFTRYGGKAIILARFLPIIRTITPVMAGVGNMRYGTFLLYNIIGGILWAVVIPFTGFFLGNIVPGVDRYLIPIILAIIFLSALPTLIPLWHKYKRQLFQKVASYLRNK